MLWHTRLIKALKSFVSQAYKEPIWIIMTIILGSCFTFLASSQSSRPDERARLEKSNVEWQGQLEDHGKMNALHDQIMAEGEVAGRVLSQFLSIMVDMIETRRLSNREQQFEEIYTLAVDARRQAELLLSRVKGTSFSVPIYNEETRLVEALLALEIRMLKIPEDICVSYLAGDAEKLAQALQKGTSQFSIMINDQETEIARWKSMKAQLDSTFKSNLIEHERVLAQARWHRFVGFLQVPALIFIAGYVVLLGRGVKMNLNKNRRAILHVQRAFRPKKGKKKR